jgi:hypothetical protein
MITGNRSVLAKPLKFTTPTLLSLIKRRGGEPHLTLGGTPTWYDDQAQRTIDQQVNAALSEHGLLGARGMDRDLVLLLESIAHPQLEYYGWFDGTFADAPSNFTVFAGSGKGGAFVLVRTIGEEVVIVAPERPDELLRGFINQIPQARPGNGTQLVVGKQEFTTGRAPSSGEFSVMQSDTRQKAPAPGAEMKRIMAAERTGAGTLYVAARNQAGARKRCQRPLNFIDTVEGRWLMEEAPGRGEPLVVFTPATPQLLGDRLRIAQSLLPAI